MPREGEGAGSEVVWVWSKVRIICSTRHEKKGTQPDCGVENPEQVLDADAEAHVVVPGTFEDPGADAAMTTKLMPSVYTSTERG
eukprot:CAMPEP_0202014896 /NCGR_PEP_ID=MMETSP0905-20130828/30397_1 /ASSEMBLY_ACC=CAM_ASM_000554 /TAXON_ID=420261 /ORGANISM="Thalassiosira antarctica, Strain CCMP982" /LENGTH=83 /DNA_ID=CAMNT_0048574925 /DNA_START=79 /DNA_END=327 /DNA_ORIENTATION=+